MPYFLLIDDKTWRLPLNTDQHRLHAAIRQSMADGQPTVIQVELGDDPRGQIGLIVNGRAVGQYAVVELPEPG